MGEIKLTTDEFAELEALAEINDAIGGPDPLMRKHWHESGYRKFARAGLVSWSDPPKGFRKTVFAGAMITTVGRSYLNAQKGESRE